MQLTKLVQIAVTLALLAAGTKQLPQVIYGLHVAQLQLLKSFQASHWPKAYIPPVIKHSAR